MSEILYLDNFQLFNATIPFALATCYVMASIRLAQYLIQKGKEKGE